MILKDGVFSPKIDERVRVWNVENFTQDSILIPPQQTFGLTFSANLKRLAGWDYPNAILVWDAETKERLSVVAETWEQDYWPLTFSPDGKILAGRSRERLFSNKVELWEADTGAQLFTLEGHTDVVSEYIFSSDSKTFASGGADGTTILWDVKTGKKLTALTGHSERISALAFSTDGKTLASGSGNTILLSDVRTGDPVDTLDAVENVRALAFSPDGNTLTSGSTDGLIQVWELDPNYQIQATFAGHQGAIYVLTFSPDGKILASGSADGTILLWDMEDHSQLDDK